MIAKLGRLGHRFTVLLSGEALQSAFNFGLNVTLARVLPVESYGAFAIVVLIGAFSIIYMRALINVPALTYMPQSQSTVRARSYAVTFGSGALVVSILSTVCASSLLALWEPGSALAGGVFVGAWALRSYIRMAMATLGRSALAAFSDLGFVVTAMAVTVPLVLTDHGGALLPHIFIAIAFAHFVGSGLALAILRQPVRVSFRRSIRKRFVTLLPTMTWSIISVTVANVQGQGGLFLLAVIAGPAAYAPIAITMSFFAPLRLATASVMNMMMPDFAANLARPGSRGVMDLLVLPMAIILLVCGLFGVMMILGFPALARHAFADRFDDAPLDLIAVLNWCIASTAVLYAVPKLQLETAKQFRLTTVMAGIAAVVGMTLMAVLLKTTSPAWSLVGLLVSEIIILIGCLIFAYRLTRQSAGLAPAAAPQHFRFASSAREPD